MKYKYRDDNNHLAHRLYKTFLDKAAFWQGVGFILLIFMIWAIRVFDVAGFLFNPSPENRLLVELSLMTALIIVMGFVVMVHSYVQQKRLLEGVIKVCSYCKKAKIKDTEWTSLEAYISDRSLSDFSHGTCPDCYAEIMSDNEDDLSG